MVNLLKRLQLKEKIVQFEPINHIAEGVSQQNSKIVGENIQMTQNNQIRNKTADNKADIGLPNLDTNDAHNSFIKSSINLKCHV